MDNWEANCRVENFLETFLKSEIIDLFKLKMMFRQRACNRRHAECTALSIEPNARWLGDAGVITARTNEK